MKVLRKYPLVLFLLFSISFCEAQQFLSLDIYKITGFKRIKFYEGDKMIIRTKEDRMKYSGKLFLLNDSTIQIEGANIFLKEIDKIYIDMSTFVVRKLSNFIFLFGAGFVLLDTFNNAVNGDDVIIQSRAVVWGSSLMLSGWAMKKLSIKKYKIGRRKILKMIDVTLLPLR